VHLEEIHSLGWNGLWATLVLIWVIRPISAWLSTYNTQLTWQERVFLGVMGPRGIIAAAIASMFASRMASKGYVEGEHLRALVFLVICASVTSAAVLGPLFGKWLKLKKHPPHGWLILGANPFGRLFAHALQHWDTPYQLIDANLEKVKKAQVDHLNALYGNGFDALFLDQIKMKNYQGTLAVLQNPEVNWLFSTKIRELYPHANRMMSLLKKESSTLDPNRVKEEHLKQDQVSRLFGPHISIQTWSDTLRSTDQLKAGLGYWTKKQSGQISLEAFCNSVPFALPILIRNPTLSTLSPIHDQSVFTQHAELALWIAPENLEAATHQLESLGWVQIDDHQEQDSHLSHD
jgi:hypothetical protein